MIVSREVSSNIDLGERITNGIAGRVEPALYLNFKENLNPEQIKLIDEVTKEAGINGYTISSDYKGIEIYRVEEYKQQYDPKEFYKNLQVVMGRLNSTGIPFDSELGHREIWLTASESSGKHGAYTYKHLYDKSRGQYPDAAAGIDRTLAENPYNPKIPNTNPAGNPPGGISAIQDPELKAWADGLPDAEQTMTELKKSITQGEMVVIGQRHNGKPIAQEKLDAIGVQLEKDKTELAYLQDRQAHPEQSNVESQPVTEGQPAVETQPVTEGRQRRL